MFASPTLVTPLKKNHNIANNKFTKNGSVPSSVVQWNFCWRFVHIVTLLVFNNHAESISVPTFFKKYTNKVILSIKFVITKNPKIGSNSSAQKLNDRIKIRISLHSCAGALACHHARRKERFGFHFDRIVSTFKNNFIVIYQLGHFFANPVKLNFFTLFCKPIEKMTDI